MQKIIDLPGYVKTENAILASDNDALLAYKKRKERENKIYELETEINNIKSRLAILEERLLNNG